jgi:endonuclease/exonuclease/phosphatase family metal-dependent hydrolase
MTLAIRAATWNIREGIPVIRNGVDPNRELVTMLADSDVDVVALQEVPFDDGGESATLRMISTRTQLTHVSGFSLSRSSFYSGRLSGVAVASRMPHSVEARRLLPNPHLHTRKGCIFLGGVLFRGALVMR